MLFDFQLVFLLLFIVAIDLKIESAGATFGILKRPRAFDCFKEYLINVHNFIFSCLECVLDFRQIKNFIVCMPHTVV